MDTDAESGTQDEIDDNHAVSIRSAYQARQHFITAAQQAFAEHYAAHRNQIKAYCHAYPHATVNHARKDASRLFADPRIQREISRILDRWTDLSAASLQRIEHQLARVAFADPRLLYDAAGNLLPPHQWDADTAACVASYSETPTKEGIVRKVRLRDSHAAARTLAEMKGAFEKNKAPPGIQAMFNINIGGKQMQLGAPIDQGRTINVDAVKSGKLTKASQLPAKAATKPIAMAEGKPLF
jgi:hypothetical protein